jgi:hypothetical protein
MRIYGNVLSATLAMLGDETVTASPAGSQTLAMDSVTDFNENGGTLTINGTPIEYESVDWEAKTIRLTVPLTSATPERTPVHVWDRLTDAISKRMTCLVSVQGDGDPPLTVSVPAHLAPWIPEGTRSPGAGESVILERTGTRWTVADLPGRAGVVPDGTAAIKNSEYITDRITIPAGDPYSTLTRLTEIRSPSVNGSDESAILVESTGLYSGNPPSDVSNTSIHLSASSIEAMDPRVGDVFMPTSPEHLTTKKYVDSGGGSWDTTIPSVTAGSGGSGTVMSAARRGGWCALVINASPTAAITTNTNLTTQLFILPVGFRPPVMVSCPNAYNIMFDVGTTGSVRIRWSGLAVAAGGSLSGFQLLFPLA